MIIDDLPEDDPFREWTEVEDLFVEGKMTMASMAVWLLEVNGGWLEATQRMGSGDELRQERGAILSMALYEWAGPRVIKMNQMISQLVDEAETRRAGSAESPTPPPE